MIFEFLFQQYFNHSMIVIELISIKYKLDNNQKMIEIMLKNPQKP